MRKIVLVVATILFANLLYSQQKEGKIVYERTIQMQIQINDNDAVSQMLPKTRTDKFELTFGNNRSIWKHIDEDDNSDEFGGNGMQIRMVGPGQNDIIFYDFTNAHKVEQRELFDKNFIVEDSIHKLNWKLTGESQTVLGHACQKAIAQNISKRMQMNIDNGKMEKKEVTDTSMVIAWFTTDIPVPAGPEVQGQLPGLILALDMNNGRVVYKAIEISPKADLASIKEPSKGKKVTPEQFNEERNEMMDEMQKNNQGNGGNRIIIRN
ncbi:MAG: GLPGLI family protein [Chitinophagales bacterium]